MKNSISKKMLDYGKKQSIGIKLLEVAEKNIVMKSHLFKIKGMESSDVAQELRKKIWEVRKQYNPKKSSMKTFTSFVIKNCIRNLYEKSRSRKAKFLNDAISLEELKKTDFSHTKNISL